MLRTPAIDGDVRTAMMVNTWNTSMTTYEKLLAKLHRISGRLTRDPSNGDYREISNALHHNDPQVRERAVFAGGLRWKDKTILGYIFYALHAGLDTDADNKRLMIETLASAAISGDIDRNIVDRELSAVLQSGNHSCIEVKAAFVGLLRVRELISTADLARIDYDNVVIDIDRLKTHSGARA